MDNILEILIPLILAGIYFFGNMFSGKSDGDSSPSIPSGRKGEDPDAFERQRKIQEEIRRKIAERRDGEGSHSPLGAPNSNAAPSHSQPQAASYESQMQERFQRIEATKKRAEELKQQARAFRRPQFSSSPAPRPSLARGSARATLQDPAAARAAFIYGEILGQPISLRKTQTIPGLIKS
jgi:hypothetical protein